VSLCNASLQLDLSTLGARNLLVDGSKTRPLCWSFVGQDGNRTIRLSIISALVPAGGQVASRIPLMASATAITTSPQTASFLQWT
jgi:hypothetical protein